MGSLVKAALLLATCLVGCSGDGGTLGTTGPGDGGGSMTSGPSGNAPYVDAFCSLARTCCGRAAFPAEPLATCESEIVRQTHTLQAIMDGTATVNEAAMAACVAAIRSAESSCTIASLPSACVGLVSGTVAEGQPCRWVDECIHGNAEVACVKVSTAGGTSPEKGVCRPLQRGTSGSPCIFSAYGNFTGSTYTSSDPNPVLVFCHDADGLRCSSANRTCVPLAAEGAACGGDQLCRSELYCDTTCHPKKAAGAACASSDECGGPTNCVNGSCAPIPVASAKLCGGDYN